MPNAAETVLTFLESVGRRSEAELYLELFRRLPKRSFAAIALGTPLLRYAPGAVVEQLRFLGDLGLRAPLLLGLDAAPVPPGGGEKLQQRLLAAGLNPTVCPSIVASSFDSIEQDLEAERTPILNFAPSATESERYELVSQLMLRLETRKLVILRRQGGIGTNLGRFVELSPNHRLPILSGGISVVNLRNDLQPLLASKQITKREKQLLSRAQQLLAALPAQRHVSIASPFNLLKELFTVRGGGTLIKAGAAISRHDSYTGIDISRLRGLLEKSFSRKLSHDYFDHAPAAVYVEENYAGVAILHESSLGAYLSKFAVEPVARGEGIGQDLWQTMTRDFPTLFWRARADNPIVGWYATIADGLIRLPAWHVFWRGLPPERVPEVVAEALGKPADLTDHVQ